MIVLQIANKLSNIFIGLTFLQERLQHVLIFTPTLDYESPNPFFPEHPNTLIQRGVKVPWLLGNNSCEGSFLICSTFFGRKCICLCVHSLNILIATVVYKFLYDVTYKEQHKLKIVCVVCVCACARYIHTHTSVCCVYVYINIKQTFSG